MSTANPHAAGAASPGGSSEKRRWPPRTLPLRDARDVHRALAKVAGALLRGDVEPKVANSFAYLATSILTALEVSDIEQRLRELEGRRP